MIIMQTLIGLIFVYLMFCLLLAWSGRFDNEVNKFIHFCIVVGNIMIVSGIIMGLLFLSYIVGSIIYHN